MVYPTMSPGALASCLGWVRPVLECWLTCVCVCARFKPGGLPFCHCAECHLSPCWELLAFSVWHIWRWPCACSQP